MRVRVRESTSTRMYEYEYARVRVLLHERLVLFWFGTEADAGGAADEQLLCVSISSMMARASV